MLVRYDLMISSAHVRVNLFLYLKNLFSYQLNDRYLVIRYNVQTCTDKKIIINEQLGKVLCINDLLIKIVGSNLPTSKFEPT